MDDTADDRPTAQWSPAGDGDADAPTQVVRFPAPRPRPMPEQQATPAAPDEAPTAVGPAVVEPRPERQQATRSPDEAPTAPQEAVTAPKPVEAPPVDDEPTNPDALHAAMATRAPESEYTGMPAPAVAAGDVFAERYRLEQQLASRGGALTWRAFDQKLSRSVLVHVLGADDPRTTDVLEAARKAAFATDSRFLRVLDAVTGEAPGSPSLVVCEFAPGESLERLLQQGPLSALEAAWVARELADAMSAMHAEGLFHQRINPDTVIITATGNVKIVGFLIEAALYPDDGDGQLAWSEREHADVRAIGKVLYASLVTRWPTPRDQVTGDDGEPRTTWGMAPAPMDGRGWLTPRQIRSGVSPALDVICDQILSDAPRHNEMPLRTASQVTSALTKVLGTADAAADLERRMRYPVVPVAGEDSRQSHGALSGDRQPAGLDTTARMRPVRDEPGQEVGRGARAAAVAGAGAAAVAGAASAAGRVAQRPRTGSSDPANAAAAGPGNRLRTAGSRPQPRRWFWILAALVALALIAGIIRVATHVAGSGSGGSSVVAISAVNDFDPTADGGNGEENPGEVKLATDGNTSTAWQTVVYLNDPSLGRLKPGVGLVLDLGSTKKVSSVTLTLQGQPTAVQLRTPATSTTGGAPMTSVKQWSIVAQNTSAGTSVTLTPSGTVETRYLLVYLTKLPKVATNRYRGGIAEVEVHS